MRNIKGWLAAAGILFVAAVLAAEPGPGGPGPGDDTGMMLAMGPGGDGPGGGMEAGGPGGGEGMRAHGGPGGMLASLNLSQAQKDKLKQLRRARRDKTQAAHNALEDAQEDLRDLMSQTDRSKGFEEKLRAKHAEVMKLDQQLRDDRFESLLEIRAVLTDEQLKKFVSLHAMPGGKGKRGPGGKGHDRDHGKAGDKDGAKDSGKDKGDE